MSASANPLIMASTMNGSANECLYTESSTMNASADECLC